MTVELEPATRPTPAGGRCCEHCTAPLVRREGERLYRWEARRFCDADCYVGYRYKTRPGPARKTVDGEPETKTCETCSGEMRRRDGERLNRWLTRTCCSKACAIRQRVRREQADIPDETKQCRRDGCLVMMSRVELGMAPSRFKVRHYCSDDCQRLARRTAGGDARREGRKRNRARKETRAAGTPIEKKPPPPAVPSAPAPRSDALPWRPAGWTARPNVWAGHKPYSDEVA